MILFGLLATIAVLGSASYLGYQATIGCLWSHNQALDACVVAVEGNRAYDKAAISARDTWTWWLPGHSHVCVYDLPDGGEIVRPVPSEVERATRGQRALPRRRRAWPAGALTARDARQPDEGAHGGSRVSPMMGRGGSWGNRVSPVLRPEPDLRSRHATYT
jgi:hypothetical protein